MATIHGTSEPRFARVREAFEHNFAENGDIGAACAVMNQMNLGVAGDPRAASLLQAIYASLD